MKIPGIWLGLIVIALIVFIISFLFARYFSEKHSSPILHVIAAISISTALLTVFLLPIDVYTVSSHLNSDGSHENYEITEEARTTVLVFFITFYSLMLLFIFFIMPFFYFWYEEGEGIDNFKPRIIQALSYTAIFAVIFIILFILGAVLKNNGGKPSEDWMQDLDDEFTAGSAALSFALGSLSVFGLMGWVLYTPYGLAILPMKMLFQQQQSMSKGREVLLGSVSGDDRILFLEKQLKINKEKQVRLNEKYDLTTEKMTLEDESELNELRREEEQLRVYANNVNTNSIKENILVLCKNITSVLKIPFGILLLLITQLIIISFFLTTIDKFLNSECGLACGYIVIKSSIFNPLDYILNALSKYFPLDLIMFAMILTYMFVCSASGMMMLGVRLCGYKVYDIKKGRTMSHALLMGTWILMFILLVFNMQIMTLTPQYAAFGTQFYYPLLPNPTNSTNISIPINAPVTNQSQPFSHISSHNDSVLLFGPKTYCTILQKSSSNYCMMTETAQFMDSFQLTQPYLGVPIFFSNVLFLFIHYMSTVYFIYRHIHGSKFKRSNYLSDIWD